MPPFREGPIVVDRRFDGEALKELRDIGHGHRINIVDASYDIPRGAKVINFPGSSADCLVGIVKLIPIEDEVVEFMYYDPEFKSQEHEGTVNRKAGQNFDDATDRIFDATGIALDTSWRYRTDEMESEGLSSLKGLGFYGLANNHGENTLFIRTLDELPFACASLVAGHSQRTE